nr:hypothetical protein [Candidatus Sigynarchaeota archaeon]
MLMHHPRDIALRGDLGAGTGMNCFLYRNCEKTIMTARAEELPLETIHDVVLKRLTEIDEMIAWLKKITARHPGTIELLSPSCESSFAAARRRYQEFKDDPEFESSFITTTVDKITVDKESYVKYEEKLMGSIRDLYFSVQRIYARPREDLELVYTTRTGRLYHRKHCGYLSRSRSIYKHVRFQASALGYDACRCIYNGCSSWWIYVMCITLSVIISVAVQYRP